MTQSKKDLEKLSSALPSSTLQPENIQFPKEPSTDNPVTPRKSESLDCILLDAVSLNNHGVEAYQVQEFELSHQYFEDAKRTLDASVPQSPTSVLDSITKYSRITNHDELSQVAKCPCDQLASTRSTSYIYQRMEFDEGMDMHTHVIRLSGSDTNLDIEATILYNLGQGYRRRNTSDSNNKAEVCYEACLEKCDKICELRAIALHNHGMVKYERGRTREAIELFTKVLGLAKLVWGNGHTNVATCYNCLGVLHYHLLSSNISTENELNLAWHYFNTALDIQVAKFGRDHEKVATIYNNMGRLHVQNDQSQKALGLYAHALRIRAEVLGEDSLDYAVTAFNAGQSYHHMGDLDRALEFYTTFLSVASKRLSRNHRDIAMVLSGMAQIHQQNGDHTDALKVSSMVVSFNFLILMLLS